jgi:selenoprotein W-related protein
MTKVLPQLKKRFTQYELVPSAGGRFEIFAGDTQIYSKLESGQFPSDDEIVTALQQHA